VGKKRGVFDLQQPPTFTNRLSTDIHRLSPTTATLLEVVFLGFGLHFYPVCELRDLVKDRPALSHQLADFSIGMHHSGVITAAESLTNFWQR
jgi:hypothetical protein